MLACFIRPRLPPSEGDDVLERRIYDWLSVDSKAWPAVVFRIVHHLLVVAGLAALVLDTVTSIHAAFGPALEQVFDAALGAGVIDLLALLPLVAMAAGVPLLVARVAGIVWILKFGHYSEGLALVGRVLRNARGPVESLFMAFLVVLLLAATLEYLAEHSSQPEAFSSIPASLYWAVTTLTTTGYGDVVPLTSFGRFIAGLVMICGIATFAFLAGILANAFAEEMHRREFLRTWDLVARVPLFRDVGAGTIAEVAKLLRPHDVPAGAIVTRRGEPGDCMYFIVAGEVEIQIQPAPLLLTTGQFFGEIALVTGGPRTATVIARQHCQFLLLDLADFRRLASQQPDLMRAIDEEARRRLSATQHSQALHR